MNDLRLELLGEPICKIEISNDTTPSTMGVHFLLSNEAWEKSLKNWLEHMDKNVNRIY